MKITQFAFSAAVLIATAPLAFADTVEGKIVAYDRKAHVLVMEDRTIYSLTNYDAPVLAELKAGDNVKIEFQGEGEDGYGLVTSVEVKN